MQVVVQVQVQVLECIRQAVAESVEMVQTKLEQEFQHLHQIQAQVVADYLILQVQ
jgi:hypothetical protein